jgi:hypothetical protein
METRGNGKECVCNFLFFDVFLNLGEFATCGCSVGGQQDCEEYRRRRTLI